MSSKAHPVPTTGGRQEEGLGGAFDGRAQGSHKAEPPLRPRPRIYGEDVLAALRFVWAALDAPAGKRLAPVMEVTVEALERHGELQLRPEVRAKLLRISPATIDRALAPDRRRSQIRGRARTKPGSILRSQIPIRTFAEWDDLRPGFCEADLVAHDGGSGHGEYCQTLDVTCVATGWTEMRALRSKAQRWVLEALRDIREAFPFPLLGLDCDNGGEFINVELFGWCEAEGITFTRTRPYRKNDNCFVEQKNWPVVRQQVGYLRYDTPDELAALGGLYAHLRLYVNFFQPQMRLVAKTRCGAKVSKTFDVARTPLPAGARLSGCGRRHQRRAAGDLHGAQPRSAQTQHHRMPRPAHRTGQHQQGGENPTEPLLRPALVLEATFEDIFGEATGEGLEDILT